ncbi:MAG: citrate/2-methylcitrate synthase [Longimicrobiales bacterium]
MTSKGLEGVVAAESELGLVLGEEGRLIYRGYDIQDLAEHTTFEEVCHLLWYGALPNRRALHGLQNRMATERHVRAEVIDILRRLPRETHPMAALRTAVSVLAHFDPDAEDMSADANARKAVRITAQMITLAGAFERLRRGEQPLQPRDDLGHAANFLYMATGRLPDDLQTRIMDVAFTLHAEHGLNASTFAARVTVATLADMHSGTVSAIGTLKGPLHGGANQRVMEMLEQIPGPEAVPDYVASMLDRGEKIMGFGHRVYRTLDPRAPILRRFAEEYARRAGDTRWLDIANRVVEVMGEEMEARGKKVYPNVDFFSAPLYYTIGVPADSFTVIFACARAAGWTAHMLEQLRDNRLIRPKADYTGPLGLTATPIDQRD